MRFLLLSFALFAAVAGGAMPLKRFPLHKPILEFEILVCKTAAVPIRLNTMLAEGHPELSAFYREVMSRGECGSGHGYATYVRQVHRIEHDAGLLTVYEIRGQDGSTWYVPLMGFLHEGVDA
jgi:hypothetical protein